MFVFVLNPTSGLPTYVQLTQQVKNGIRMGVLRPGDRLPTAKEVVSEFAINPNTVLKAYRELEREGLVSPRPGAGTFVCGSLGSVAPEVLERMFDELCAWAARARGAGLEEDDITALFAGISQAPARRRA
jgi:GntR family transcriptional regulator